MKYCEIHSDPSDWDAEDGYECPYCWALMKKQKVIERWTEDRKQLLALERLLKECSGLLDDMRMVDKYHLGVDGLEERINKALEAK